jgi:acetate kinase
MKILVLNCGSSSLKFQVVECHNNHYSRLARGGIKRIDSDASFEFLLSDSMPSTGTISIRNHEEAVRLALDWLATVKYPVSGKSLLHDLSAAGHRVVHGGSCFTGPVLIDDAVIREIEALNDLAPLHNPASVSGIREVRSILGQSFPMVAVFDTAFHHTLPEHVAMYAIPYDLSLRHRIKRYGFHGTAHHFLALRYSEITSTPPEEGRIITLQLGNGCSVTAIRNGKSVDTSMGFTPLEGLVMGTRSGSIDPAIIGYLARKENLGIAEIETILNERSGMLGISGYSNDMSRVLECAHVQQAERCRLAVDIFCYSVRKCIGSYLAALGGADALVFSGGIGENSSVIRRQICEGMEWCGLRLDAERNSSVVGREGRISADNSGIHAYVIPVDEELLIARNTAGFLSGTSSKNSVTS